MIADYAKQIMNIPLFLILLLNMNHPSICACWFLPSKFIHGMSIKFLPVIWWLAFCHVIRLTEHQLLGFWPLDILQVMSHLKTVYAQQQQQSSTPSATPTRASGPVRRTVVTRVFEAVRAIALCHNVTPVYEEGPNSEVEHAPEADQHSQQSVSYQASSPDEV